MAAPKGNKLAFFYAPNMDRDKLFKTPELLWEAACEYFQWCEDNPIEAADNKGTKNVNIVKFKRPFTIKGFCLYCDASEHWYNEYKGALDPKENKDFWTSVIKELIIYSQKFDGAAIGIFNANIIARDLGLTDKSEIKTNGRAYIRRES